jgi:hypothetical protein
MQISKSFKEMGITPLCFIEPPVKRETVSSISHSDSDSESTPISSLTGGYGENEKEENLFRQISKSIKNNYDTNSFDNNNNTNNRLERKNERNYLTAEEERRFFNILEFDFDSDFKELHEKDLDLDLEEDSTFTEFFINLYL